MTMPASIRVNTQAPFPSLVNSTAPATISKANGVWTIGLSIASLGTQVPVPGSYATDFVLVWDSVNQTYFKMSLTAVLALPVYTVATLPTGTLGARAAVSDATGSPAFLGTATGGGAVKAPVFHNGTTWVYG
jgi:hypothetical protein